MYHYIFGFLLLFTLASCHKDQNANHEVFTYNESQGVATLDPAFARRQVDIWPMNQIFNGLIQLDDSLNILPCIAKQWQISDDQKTYTFKLRNDIYFHNHKLFKNNTRKVNAFDVVYSLKRILDPKTASPGSWVLAPVAKKDDAIIALNDTTLKITLQDPFPGFLGVLSMQYCAIVPKEIVEYYGKDFAFNPIGTGPFQLKYWKNNEKLILVKNPLYFEKDQNGYPLPYLKAINISFIKDKQSEFLEFLNGNIDLLRGVHNTYKNELLTQKGKLNPKYAGRFDFLQTNYLNTEYLGFYLSDSTSANNPIQNLYFRKAFNHCFDRKEMMLYLRNNLGYPANGGIIPQGLDGHQTNIGYSYNPDSVFKYLKLYEEDGGKIKTITLTTTADYLDICEYIQKKAEDFGIEIEIEVKIGSKFREDLVKGNLSIFRASWIADYADAENYLALFYSKNHSPNGPNYTHFKNGLYDNMYVAALNAPSVSRRTELYKKMDSLIMKEAAIVPLYYDQVVLFTNQNFTGIQPNPINLLHLKHVKSRKIHRNVLQN